ncbi:elongation factor G [Rhodothermus marinus]|uniref:elongation factor G n=1 Tax=Rhodothermus marinus TaxID=29549 RepID=UPI0037CAA0FA
MKVYEATHIRNVALVGHQGSGKTMLTEAMLYTAGVISRMGSIEEGNTVSDYHPSEKERGMSVFTSLLHVPWQDHKINVLDTPGYPDFVGEVLAALRVADLAIYVMNAVEGVQVGTELAWEYGLKQEIPSMFVVNHLDRAESDFRTLVAQIKERFGRGATVVQIPAGTGTRTIIDVLHMKQLTYPKGSLKPEENEIDPAFREEAEELHTALIEDIAENDEGLMELYFEKGTLTEDEMRKGLRAAMIRRQLFPIFVVSATEVIGISRLLSFLVNVAPSPADMPPAKLADGGTLAPDPSGPPVAFIFRTMAEQHVGDFSYFRVYSGTLEQGMDLENAQTGTMERLGPLYAMNGREREAVPRMVAGDLGATVKLRDTHTNNTLRPKGTSFVLPPIEFPEPRYAVAVRPLREGDEDKMMQGLHQLVEEDPSLKIIQDPLLRQIVLAGQGEMHLEIARFRLKNRFGVEVEFVKPKVAYRETIQTSARTSYRHKKQTGGAGQFADISIHIEPLTEPFQPPSDITVRGEVTVETNWGARVHFVDAIVGGVIDMKRFFGAIQKGVLEAMQNGPIAGYPVGDVRVIIYHGGMHPVDSNEAAFKTAARMAFREAFKKAQPVLLEPIDEVEVIVPDAFTGDVMGDLNTRRARIQGIETEGVFQKIKAYVPEAELYRYATTLRSLTQGRGIHRARFSHYEPMPRHVQDKVVAEAEAMQEA